MVLQELHWLPVSYYLIYTVGVLAFKCAKGLPPSYLSYRFVTRFTVHDCNTRNKENLNIPAYQLAAGQRTFLYRATLELVATCNHCCRQPAYFQKKFRNY